MLARWTNKNVDCAAEIQIGWASSMAQKINLVQRNPHEHWMQFHCSTTSSNERNCFLGRIINYFYKKVPKGGSRWKNWLLVESVSRNKLLSNTFKIINHCYFKKLYRTLGRIAKFVRRNLPKIAGEMIGETEHVYCREMNRPILSRKMSKKFEHYFAS